MSSSKLRGIVWLALGILTAILFTFGLTFSISKFPWSLEKKLGSKLSAPMQTCRENSALKKIVMRLYPIMPTDSNFDLSVQVVKGETINAFAFLGGQIYIYEGLLREAEGPTEVAGILAHEIAHITRRDVLQGLASRLVTFASLQIIFGNESDHSLFNSALSMQFTRRQEADADGNALKRLKQAGISGSGLANFFDRIEKLSTVPSFLSDHPKNEERARLARKLIIPDEKEILSSQEWLSLKNICEE